MLPNNWAKEKIINLISSNGIFSDGDWVESKDQDPNGSIRLIQLADIGDGFFIDKSDRYINKDKFSLLNCTEIYHNDILVARMPNPLGRATLFPNLGYRCITVVDVAIIRPGKDSVFPTWLMHFINSPQIRQKINELSSGTTRKRIARKKLGQIEIPVPPISEQKRMAAKLDALFGHLTSCQEHLDRVPDILEQIRQSVLAEAMSGRLTVDWRDRNKIPHDWEYAKIQDLTSKVGSGSTPKGGKASYKETGIPLIRSMNVIFFGFKYDGLAFIDDEQAEKLKNVELKRGDVLLNITGASIGRVTILPDELEGGRVNQHVCIIRPKKTILSQFLNYYLSSPKIQNKISQENYGVTRPALTKSQILGFDISLPLIEEQAEIINRIDALFNLVDSVESRYSNMSDFVDQLNPSLLELAFSGGLVPQDPDDEPASILLERIKSERKERIITEKPPRRIPMAKDKDENITNANAESILAALWNSGRELNTEELFSNAGFPSDADSDIVENFFVIIRELLEQNKISKKRVDDTDWFSLEN